VARGPSLGCGRYRHPSGDTHYVAEGGGRELAYVAMSRARGPSIVHAVADDLGQAIDDITHDWSFDRNQQWISRTARPGVDPTIGAVPSDPKSTRAHLVAELATLDRVGPPAVGADLAAAHEDLDRHRRARSDLDHGTGRWVHSPAGRAAHQLAEARNERRTAEYRSRVPVGRRERRRWQRMARIAASAELRAQEDWSTHAKPVADRLDRRIVVAERRVADLESQATFRQRWLAEHPELARRVAHVQRELQRFDDPMRADLLDRLDALSRGDAPVVTQVLERSGTAKVLERLDRLERARDIEPPGLSL
jgi:uncharacterized coiled-coil protein SlyX